MSRAVAYQPVNLLALEGTEPRQGLLLCRKCINQEISAPLGAVLSASGYREAMAFKESPCPFWKQSFTCHQRSFQDDKDIGFTGHRQ